MTVCPMCGNSGSVPEFLANHTCSPARENLTANGKAYVTRSVNMYLPAHRADDGTVRALHTSTGGWFDSHEFVTEWSTKGVCPETFIAD